MIEWINLSIHHCHHDHVQQHHKHSEWLLTKIVNGERASYSAPKFARMQERTRSQMLEDIVANLANHAETGQIPKPYRRGSWRPIGHMRPSSPLLDSVRDQFEGELLMIKERKREKVSQFVWILNTKSHTSFTDYDQLAKDFTRVFLNIDPSCITNAHLFDVVFLVGQSKQKARYVGVRAILGVRSRVFQVKNWYHLWKSSWLFNEDFLFFAHPSLETL